MNVAISTRKTIIHRAPKQLVRTSCDRTATVAEAVEFLLFDVLVPDEGQDSPKIYICAGEPCYISLLAENVGEVRYVEFSFETEDQKTAFVQSVEKTLDRAFFSENKRER